LTTTKLSRAAGRSSAVRAPHPGALATATNDGKTNVASVAILSVRRLNVMRIGYAVMAVGIAARNWPLIIGRSEPWPFYEGATKYMMVAMGLLALLGSSLPGEDAADLASNQLGNCSGWVR
jgi:hypothetical protein